MKTTQQSEPFQGPITVQHEHQVSTKDGWKVELWLGASADRLRRPVSLYLRLTPTVPPDQLPKVVVVSTLSLAGRELAKEKTEPAFALCSTMPKKKEMVRRNRDFETPTDFPPKATCWQAKLLLFDGVGAEDGEYDIKVAVELDGKPLTSFANIRMAFLIAAGK